jgi:RNA polymerase sigma-70 factor (sigma-E family)
VHLLLGFEASTISTTEQSAHDVPDELNHDAPDGVLRVGVRTGADHRLPGGTVTDGSDPGTDEDFRAFVQARWPDLVRYAYLFVGDRQHAEDLVQVALEGTWRRWRRARVDRPESYVRTAIARRAASRHRWLGRRPKEWPAGDRVPETGAADAGSDGLRDLVWSELGALPPRMRAVVVLRLWEDLGERETADVLGCSTGAVKSQLSRGLARLRTHPALRDAAGLPALVPTTVPADTPRSAT